MIDTNGHITILDFGLAQPFTKRSHTMHNQVGTPYYIAPEVYEHNYSEKCDIWSIGVIIYCSLSGLMPFDGNNLNEIQRSTQSGAYNITDGIW